MDEETVGRIADRIMNRVCDKIAAQVYDKIKNQKENDTQMAKVNLSSPWVKLYREFQEMFKEDKEVKVIFDEDAYDIRIYVDNDAKAVAMANLLEGERIYGNITVTITVYPANGDWEGVYDRLGDEADEYDPFEQYNTLFKDNPAFSYALKSTLPFWDGMIYVVFKNKVVQYFNDDLSDVNGNCSTLYQEIAKDLFTSAGRDSVFFCTDTPENTGEPLGEWP